MSHDALKAFVPGAGFCFGVGEGATMTITPIVTATAALPTMSNVLKVVGFSFGGAITTLATAVAARDNNGLTAEDTVKISRDNGMRWQIH